jgi:hypothetical protein
MRDFAIAVLPLVGVAVGAALQFWLSRAAEREKQIETLRAQAYADHLRAVAASAHLRSDEDERDAHLNAADAKARIAVQGTASVVSALARFEETGAVVRPEGPSATAFVAVVSAMRLGSDAAPDRDLKLVLFGSGE